jgi:hypothetical protein
VKILVQQIGTARFLAAPGRWVEKEAEAKEFSGTGEAISYCVQEGLTEVRIGMMFGDPKLDIFLYPFQNQETLSETEAVKKRNRELQVRQEQLMEAVKAAGAELAASKALLPLARKKKREKPPEGDGER